MFKFIKDFLGISKDTYKNNKYEMLIYEYKKRIEEFDKYKQWREKQVCVDCGAKASDRKRDKDGVILDEDTWVTEIQCLKCWKKNGCPENRGLPSSKQLAEKDGLKVNLI